MRSAANHFYVALHNIFYAYLRLCFFYAAKLFVWTNGTFTLQKQKLKITFSLIKEFYLFLK